MAVMIPFIPIIIFYLAHTTDVITTWRGLSLGIPERGLLFRLTENFPVVTVLKYLLATVIVIIVLHFPVLTPFLYLDTGVEFSASLHNYWEASF